MVKWLETYFDFAVETFLQLLKLFPFVAVIDSLSKNQHLLFG